MNEKDLIATGRQWLEHSPPATTSNPDIAGWKNPIQVCSTCAGRIIGRGCNLQLLATEPVWKPDTVSCDLC